ncbi:hypothetical protein CRG98_009474 [Punica granatum]|uniref:Reverse transcriptase domain-containing protein n=1 Tax=Punica granatum TaxID=22663 RepID=A0A2I0KNU2_PUNGR|nr:hypothetical protein CRG98_009474 [Punica granatum]
MRSLRRKKGFMAIKVDLEKAYDSFTWDFIDDTLRVDGVPDVLRIAIMGCITTPTLQILSNGEASETFSMGRGIRQGCPLSPYIFLLCIERLGHIITDMVRGERWRPIRIGTNGPAVSNIMFADDLLLFAEASLEQIQRIMEALQLFCGASGQRISAEKTMMFFSKNENESLRHQIYSCCSFTVTDDLGKYLGVPLIHGRVTRQTHYRIVDRVKARLSGWLASTLSMAGRVTLVKSVLTSIPSFTMQSTRILLSILSEIERLCRDFVWVNSMEQRKIHLSNWNAITQQLLRGWLGIRRLNEFNDAFLAKICWGLIMDQDALWARALAKRRDRQVCDAAEAGREWRWDAFADLLPHGAVLSIVATLPPTLERVRNFLWIVDHGKLLANEARLARGLGGSGLCPICNSAVETVLHVLRDYPYTDDVRRRLLPYSLRTSFFADYREQWLVKNLSLGSKGSVDIDWATISGAVGLDGAAVVDKVAKSFAQACSLSSDTLMTRTKVWKSVGWIKPDYGWVKLDTDGAAKDNLGRGAAGGLLRDANGSWLGGFVHNVWITTSLPAENLLRNSDLEDLSLRSILKW